MEYSEQVSLSLFRSIHFPCALCEREAGSMSGKKLNTNKEIEDGDNAVCSVKRHLDPSLVFLWILTPNG